MLFGVSKANYWLQAKPPAALCGWLVQHGWIGDRMRWHLCATAYVAHLYGLR